MPDIVAGVAAAIECAADDEKDAVGLSAAAAADKAFKSFRLAMAEQNHERAARVGTFGGAMQVVDGGGLSLQLHHKTKIRSFRKLTRSALAQTARVPSLHMTDTTPAH